MKTKLKQNDFFVERMTKDFQDQLNNYKKKLLSLVANNLDYEFLRELIKECNPNLEINITLNDGTKLNIKTKESNEYRRPTL